MVSADLTFFSVDFTSGANEIFFSCFGKFSFELPALLLCVVTSQSFDVDAAGS